MLLASTLQCSAVINMGYKKPTDAQSAAIDDEIVDLNDLRQYDKSDLYDDFVSPIIDFANFSLDESEVSYIFHLHDYEDHLLGNNCQLIVGAGHDKKQKRSCLSAPATYTDQLVQAFNQEGLACRITKNPNLSAIEKHDLNQLFKQYLRPRNDIYSVRLGCKSSINKGQDLLEAVRSMAKAIQKVTGAQDLKEPEATDFEPLVVTELLADGENDPGNSEEIDQAIHFIIDTYQSAAQQAMFTVGTYLVETFFNGDYKLARNPRNINGNESLNRIRKGLELFTGSPSKTWVYDALKVTLDQKLFEEDTRYAKLSVSHKIKLLSVSDLAQKKELIELSNKQDWSVRKLHQEIQNRKMDSKSLYTRLNSLVGSKKKFKYAIEEKGFSIDLKQLSVKERKKIAARARKQEKSIDAQIQELQRLKKMYGKLK